jgi:hypothetical protein
MSLIDTPGIPPFRKFIKLDKVDEAKREVGGIVTAEVEDREGEICHYKTTKPFYEEWSADLAKVTDGKNLGNLRVMHGLTAAGVGKSLEFDDDAKAIRMTFKVVDDDAWKGVVEGMYSGFSHGGSYVRTWTTSGKKYYTGRPSEVSLVDAPCLVNKRAGVDAYFEFVRADGAKEMRKFKKIKVEDEMCKCPCAKCKGGDCADCTAETKCMGKAEEPVVAKADQPAVVAPAPAVSAPPPTEDVATAVAKAVPGIVEQVMLALAKAEGKTKRVAGKDLPASAFAYVGDVNKTDTWKFPVHDAAHARNALARWSSAKGIPAGEKAKVHGKIVAAAKKFGIEVSEDKQKAYQAAIEKAVVDAIEHGAELHKLDKGKLAKGMYEVGRLADLLQSLCYLQSGAAYERDRELDESTIPEDLIEDMKALAETFLSMAEEETDELISAADQAGTRGGMLMSTKTTGLTKAEKTETGQLIGTIIKSINDHNTLLATSFGQLSKILGVEEANELGDEEPESIDPKKKGTENKQKAEKADGAGDTVTMTKDEITKAIEDGINSGLQTILKAMAGDEECDDDEDDKKVPPKKSAKKADGIGDRTQLPTVVSGAGPVIRVVPFTKVQDSATEPERAAVVEKADVQKALSGDRTEAIKLMKSATPQANVPPTLMDALSKRFANK